MRVRIELALSGNLNQTFLRERVGKRPMDETYALLKLRTFVIAHRLGTVEDCDMVIDLEDGKVKRSFKPAAAGRSIEVSRIGWPIDTVMDRPIPRGRATPVPRMRFEGVE